MNGVIFPWEYISYCNISRHKYMLLTRPLLVSLKYIFQYLQSHLVGILQCGKVHCHLISHSGVWPSINKLCSSTTSASAAMLSMEKVEVFFKDRVSLSSPRRESSQLSGCREQRVGVCHTLGHSNEWNESSKILDLTQIYRQ